MPEIFYEEKLINNLKREHETLIEVLLRSFKDGHESGNLDILCDALVEFKRLFQNHLAKENVQLFGYLEQSIKWHPNSLKQVRKFRRELNDQSKEIVQFCKKYESPYDLLFSRESYEKEFKHIRKMLIHRIQLVERKMYAFYDAS